MGDTGTWDEHFERFLRMRGVRNEPCRACHGLGVRQYSSTAIWRGGIGGAALTNGVCDKCWGSGDQLRPGTDLRKLEAELRRKKHEEAAHLIAKRAGADFSLMRPALRELVSEIERLGRGRKTRPEWWHNACEALAKGLREACDASETAQSAPAVLGGGNG